MKQIGHLLIIVETDVTLGLLHCFVHMFEHLEIFVTKC